jgi:hypothetical protein
VPRERASEVAIEFAQAVLGLNRERLIGTLEEIS